MTVTESFFYLLPDDVYFSETEGGANRVHNCASQYNTIVMAVCGHPSGVQHIRNLQFKKKGKSRQNTCTFSKGFFMHC